MAGIVATLDIIFRLLYLQDRGGHNDKGWAQTLAFQLDIIISSPLPFKPLQLKLTFSLQN